MKRDYELNKIITPELLDWASRTLIAATRDPDAEQYAGEALMDTVTQWLDTDREVGFKSWGRQRLIYKARQIFRNEYGGAGSVRRSATREAWELSEENATYDRDREPELADMLSLIDELPDEQGAVAVLALLSTLESAQIGKVLGMHVGRVRDLQNEACDRLVKLMNN